MKKIIILYIIFFLFSCEKQERVVNLQHSLSLVDSVEINGKMLAFISIYADAPSYDHVYAKGEGMTCVDDVGRYMEVLEYEILIQKNNKLIPIAENMANFLLHLSRDDGLWYNFLFEDGTINKEHVNSRADFGFWAVRGLRGLAAAYNIFKDNPDYENLKKEIINRLKLMNSQIKIILANYPKISESEIGKKPEWMVNDASDITNELLMVLAKLHSTGDFDYFSEMEKFSEAIILRQYNKQGSDIRGMYFCWKNIWHAWGNSHAYALLEVYKITKNEELLNSVRLWADNFIPFFLAHDFPRKIIVNTDAEYKMETYPQIAYGINSVYRGIKSLAEITREKKYSKYANRVFQWYSGANIAKTRMYDPNNGRCFDGINEGSVNFNSGAESTIECLLSMQMNENYTIK